MKQFVKKNYKLIIISMILAFFGHVFFLKNQIFNNQFMIGPYDQFSQMIIFKDLLYDEFSQGNFFYSRYFNGGANIFTRLSYYYSTSLIFYATAFITFILEQSKIIGSPSMNYWASIASLISIFRSMFILFATTKYIKIFNMGTKFALLGATFYAFSSIYFRHVILWEFFADAMIWLPIILLGTESIIRKGDGKLFTLGVALTLFNNGYFAFANLLFTSAYVMLRFIFKLSRNEESIPKQLKNYVVYGLIGLGISLPGFLPFVLGFFNTSRLSPDSSFPIIDTTDFNLGSLLLNDGIQLLPILYVIVITYFSNYKSHIFRFFSFMSFVLIFLRYSPLVASIFNGLSYPQFRWHYITFLIISTVIALGIKNILLELRINNPNRRLFLTISILLTLFFYNLANFQAEEHYFNINIVYMTIIFSYIAIFMMKYTQFELKYSLAVLLFFGSLYTVFISNKQLYDDYKLYTMNDEKIYQTFDNPDSSYEKALDIIKNDSNRFSRIDFTDMHNLGSQKDFSSFNVYSSFQNKYQQFFYRYFQILNNRENNGIVDGLAGRQILSSIFQSNYVIANSNNKYIIPSSFEELNKVDNLVIYKNQIPLSFIHPVKELYSYDDIDYNEYKDELLINGAIVPEVLSNTMLKSAEFKEEIDYTITNRGTGNKNNVLLGSNKYFNIGVQLNIEGETYDDIVIDYTLKPLDEGERGRYTYSINNQSLQLKSTGDPYSSQLYRHQVHIPFEDYIEFTLAPGADYLFEIHSIYGVSHNELIERSQDDKSLEYKVQWHSETMHIQFNNQDNYPFMVLPIFYEPGWDLEINNEKQDILNVNNGMIGFEIPEGEITIEMNYTQPFFYESVFMSLTTLSIVILLEKKWKKDI